MAAKPPKALPKGKKRLDAMFSAKGKVRKGEVKEELLQAKEKVLEVEQLDSPADSEVMEIDAPAAEVQAAQPAQAAPPSSSTPSTPAATPGRKMALLQPAPAKPA